MRTTIIPAQITTVEDKIAGSLNFTQMLLLMIPVFWAAIVYILLPQSMHLSWYKFALILVVLVASAILAIRIKDKIILQWLQVLLRFNIRPKYYVFNKNDSYLRVMDLPNLEESSSKAVRRAHKTSEQKIPSISFDLKQFVQMESLLISQKLNLSYKAGKKGGLHVAFEQVQK